MKLGTIEVTARGVPVGAGQHRTNDGHVVLQVKAGWFANDVQVTPGQAREMAAELLQAANQAEGKA